MSDEITPNEGQKGKRKFRYEALADTRARLKRETAQADRERMNYLVALGVAIEQKYKNATAAERKELRTVAEQDDLTPQIKQRLWKGYVLMSERYPVDGDVFTPPEFPRPERKGPGIFRNDGGLWIATPEDDKGRDAASKLGALQQWDGKKFVGWYIPASLVANWAAFAAWLPEGWKPPKSWKPENVSYLPPLPQDEADNASPPPGRQKKKRLPTAAVKRTIQQS